MSPASQGGLQVERYIGTCLISKADAPPSYRYPHGAHTNPHHHHHHHGGHHGGHHGAWAGLPLISMVQPRRNNSNNNNNNKPPPQQQQQPQQPSARSPLSRLAIHTQGAPLILAGRYNNRRKHGGPVGQNGPTQGGAYPPSAATGPPGPPGPPGPTGHPKGGPRGHRPLGPLANPCGPMGGPIGAPCGPLASNNKQAVALASSDSLSVASDESSGHSENSLPRIIKPRKRRKKDRKPPQIGQASDTHTPVVSLKNLGEEGHSEAHAEAHADAVTEQPDEPKLHHDFDEVKEHEHDADDEGVLLCQCRYCDPAGLIWDVDQNCYSPFLTPQPGPGTALSSFPLFISEAASPQPSPSRLFPDQMRGPTDLLLRRSWSEPSPSRKHSESSDFQESDRRSPGALEVSSEIVTSHNGHRDIEIKFFSLPASATELDLKQ